VQTNIRLRHRRSVQHFSPRKHEVPGRPLFARLSETFWRIVASHFSRTSQPRQDQPELLRQHHRHRPQVALQADHPSRPQPPILRQHQRHRRWLSRWKRFEPSLPRRLILRQHHRLRHEAHRVRHFKPPILIPDHLLHWRWRPQEAFQGFVRSGGLEHWPVRCNHGWGFVVVGRAFQSTSIVGPVRVSQGDEQRSGFGQKTSSIGTS